MLIAVFHLSLLLPTAEFQEVPQQNFVLISSLSLSFYLSSLSWPPLFKKSNGTKFLIT